jgi:small GTP-binding protein
MKEGIISVLLYAELNDELGPNPLAWLPTSYSPQDIMQIVIKVISVLSGEQGLVPQSLVFLPFPSLNLKGLIKYIKWDDPDRRGGIGQSALALLFREIDDVIFYKYMNQFSTPFEDIVRKIINLEKLHASKEDFSNLLQEFEVNVSNLLEELKSKETAQFSTEEFPEQRIKESGLIDYKFKITIVGDPGVGKTSLVLKYTNNAFRRTYIPTLGVHVSDKIFNVEDSTVQLVLWDIAGQIKFEMMRQQFYLGSDGILLIFDMTNPKSFESLSNWYLDVRKQLKNRSDLIGYVVGNKKDLMNEIKIKSEKGIELANSHELGYIETSALSGENVDSAFNNLAQQLYNAFK